MSVSHHVDTIIRINGGPVTARTNWCGEMINQARRLAETIGVPDNTAAALRPHELRALFSCAARDAAGAVTLAHKQGWLQDNGMPVQPVQPSPSPVGGINADELASIKAAILQAARNEGAAAGSDYVQGFLSSLPDTVRELVASVAPRALHVTIADLPKVELDTAHSILPRVLNYCAQRVWPYLVGPAGSGKTTIAEQVAKAFGLPFYFAAKVQDKFDLMGYMNGGGVYVTSLFRIAYETGGVFLFDEMDASDANALTAFNAALANGTCPFPDGMVKRHPDFIAIGAGNTYGSGATRQYIGRTPIDAATLDRFAFITIDYDSELEAKLAPNDKWCRYVQAMRREVESRSLRHIVSPRATITGGRMIAAGETWEDCATSLIFKGLDHETASQLKSVVRISSYRD
jgi:hypothetical protein